MSFAPVPVEIQQAGISELPIVKMIMAEAFDPQFGEAWTPSQCIGMMTLPGVWLNIAFIEAEPAGFALSRAIVDESELLLLAIRPAFRRKGIGGALLRTVISEAIDRGAITLHLEVRANNEAVHLYRSQGFEKVGQRRDYYRGVDGNHYDALTFSRNFT